MPLNRAWIEKHIPHQGRMCLLDEIIAWDMQHIRCRSATHRALGNPLRSQERLGIACGIEYAAQAMALHGALALHGVLAAGTASSAPADAPEVGLLAGVRDVHFSVSRLDDIESDLFSEAILVAGDGVTAIYEFTLRDDDRRELCGGRATIVLHAHKRLGT
jgi:predicted hotdog family 3-hydroxylacyl-ACP dehydratase